MLRDGEISGATYPGIDPRTCLGYSDDGHVYFMVADGRVEFYSYGLTYPEMGSIMKALGCSWAVNLDGGGSTQMLIRHPIADIFQIRNRPSDGQERPVVNTWMVKIHILGMIRTRAAGDHKFLGGDFINSAILVFKRDGVFIHKTGVSLKNLAPVALIKPLTHQCLLGNDVACMLENIGKCRAKEPGMVTVKRVLIKFDNAADCVTKGL